ncbi:apoptosis inducing factor mitochondria associated 4 [Scleropages formosus]|uniref:Apoptosis inducing factor mitochondria associated 4 n=1 Tax=Scleropages formosus TaxID=113540 RepID=A0A8C9R0C6_SCLFO|nr:apoptosis-inducing factor 3-like [Scleropages formosus]
MAERRTTVDDVEPHTEEVLTEEVCHESDLQEGQMMEVEVGQHKVLLVRSGGVYSAIGNSCTHYGAPLSKGALSGGRVRCPWHGACFNVKTGDIEEYPGLDCVAHHKVTIENNKVYVSAKIKSLKQPKRVKAMGRRVPAITHTVLLVGGGPAALVCAETLRQENYGGRIIMITKDDLPPYDRTKLSKAMNTENDSILLRRMEFFHEYDIEVWMNKEVKFVNTDKKTVMLNDSSQHHYDQLLIATGSRARDLECPGADLENVTLLRVPEDARKIHHGSINCRAVIIGSSFIGMEVASYLADKAASVTVIGSSKFPYERILGPEVGMITMQILQEKKVKFYMKDCVTEIKGENGKVKEVILKSGVVLPADIVIAGIGVIPNSEFLFGSSVNLDSRNMVIVDKFMKTNVPDVFSAGDVTSFPLAAYENQRVSLGHWHLAQTQGRVAALNMLNKPAEMKSVPFYWTVLAGKSIRYAGYGEGYTQVILKGKVEELKFLAFYVKDDEVVAAASLNSDPAVSQFAERIAAGKQTTKEQAESEDLSWLKLP